MTEINDLGEAVARQLGARLAAAVPSDYRGVMAGKLILRLADDVQSKGSLGQSASETAASLHSEFYVSEGGSKTPSQWLSEHWRKVEELYDDVREVLIEQCRAEGLLHYPVLVKGSGEQRPKRYYVTAQELPTGSADEAMSAVAEASEAAIEGEVPANGIRYRKDMSPMLNRVGALFFGKGRLVTLGRRMWIVAPTTVLMVLLLWMNGKVFEAFLKTARPIYPSDLVLVALVIGAPYVLFKWMSGLMDLLSLRYQVAPDWATGMKEGCAVVEVEDIDKDKGTTRVKVSRYTAACGVCGGMVYLRDGHKQFGRRVIGFCSESPDEHLFTFDPKTKLGYPLRQSKGGYVGL